MARRPFFAIGLMAGLSTSVAGCGGCGNGNGSGGGPAPRINAGGATFINPIMQKWSGEYKAAKNVEIDYVSKGSGYGIQNVSNRNLDFGCSDSPMKKEEVEAARKEGGDVIHVPLTMGGVAVVYSVPGVESPIKLTGAVLADIYLQKETARKWNDKAIADLNPGVALPPLDIVPVFRSGSSGTSSIFTEYLAKSSPEFKEKVGRTTTPKFPAQAGVRGGVGQDGNDGVAGHVKNNEGCVGYVELEYARKSKLKFAQLKNAHGAFVGPDGDGVTAAAAAGMAERQTAEPYTLHELTYSLTDAPGEKSYPIVGVSYGILYKKQPKAKGPTIVEFLKWAVSDGQQYAAGLSYAPLPTELTKKAKDLLGTVTFE